MTQNMPETEFENIDLDGHTVDELSDYLDAGRTPTNFSIESSPGCQLALTALARLREITVDLLEREASREPAPEDGWIQGIMSRIALEARAGRDIPIGYSVDTARLTITEGAVRGIVRAAGDAVPGVIVGRCELVGDVTTPAEPVDVRVEISVAWGVSMPDAAAAVRDAVYRELAKHTDLVVGSVDVSVQDVRFVEPVPEPAQEPGEDES
jgi:uncharacterized alkaline shock family protein YloU